MVNDGMVASATGTATAYVPKQSLGTRCIVEKTKVAIIGMGTVGQGVAKLLLDHGDRTARHAGRTLWLEKAVVRDINKARKCERSDQRSRN
jgi:glutamyl-tRNA reductase